MKKSTEQLPISRPPDIGQQAIYIDHYFEPPHSLYHFHETTELVFSQRSAGQRIVGDDVAPFRPEGDLLLIGPQVPHTWTADHGYAHGGTQEPETIVVHFTWESIGVEFLNLTEMAAIRHLLHEAKTGIEFTAEAIAAIREPLVALPHLKGGEQLLRFLMILQRLATIRNPGRRLLYDDCQNSSREQEHRIFSKVVQYVHAHHGRNIRLSEIAAHVGMSQVSFNRFFNRVWKTSFVPWLNEWRIQRAALLLRETRQPIAAIALKAGYRNFSHFNRWFLRTMGQTPTAYRQIQGGERH